jgi:hypothetical protein
MRHGTVLPQMAVKPQTAIHCVDHSVAPSVELSIRRVIRRFTYWQAGTPSSCAGEGIGVTFP